MPSKVPDILRAIKKEHVTDAIRYISGKGHVPPRRNSKTHALRTRQGVLYPPKYVISLAASRVTGQYLKYDEYSVAQSNATLQRLGFRIISHGTEWPESD